MCGRATLTRNEKELEERFGIDFYQEDIERYNPLPNYNVAPGQYFPVITNEDMGHFNVYNWGLIPYWAKKSVPRGKYINARAENLLSSQLFKGPFLRRRCLIPLDGFYEWKKKVKSRQPYRIALKGDKIFSVAGLWDTWQAPDKSIINTFSMVTVKANDLIKQLHGRMPAILTEEEEKLWLDNSIPTKELKALLQPYEADLMYMYPVSVKVNNVRNNSPELIKEVPEYNIIQTSLFS